MVVVTLVADSLFSHIKQFGIIEFFTSSYRTVRLYYNTFGLAVCNQLLISAIWMNFNLVYWEKQTILLLHFM